MKQITTILVAVSVALMMSACGGGSSTDVGYIPPVDTTPPPVDTTPTPEPTPPEPEPEPVLEVYIDNDTGLMWQDTAPSKDIFNRPELKPWLEWTNFEACMDDNTSEACEDTSGDTAATYCADLTLEEYTDWRLPTKDELEYFGSSGNYLDMQNVLFFYYWTSTTSTESSLAAYVGQFISDGFMITQIEKSGSSIATTARCVREM